MSPPAPHMSDLIKELKAEIIQTIKDSAIQVRYMNLKQASTYSGIGQKKLVELAQGGSILGKRRDDISRGDWSFDKESIDNYWHQPFRERKVATQRVLDRIRRKA